MYLILDAELHDLVEFNESLSFEEIQSLVGGYVELAPVSRVLREANIVACVNEEGMLYDLPISCVLKDSSGLTYGHLYGNIVFAYSQGEDFLPLSANQVAMVRKELGEYEIVGNECIHVLKL